MTLDEGHYYIYFFVAITYGKLSLWLWKSLENSGNIFLLFCGHPDLISVRLWQVWHPAMFGKPGIEFWPDLNTGIVGLPVKYLQLKGMKLVLTCHRLCDLIV